MKNHQKKEGHVWMSCHIFKNRQYDQTQEESTQSVKYKCWPHKGKGCARVYFQIYVINFGSDNSDLVAQLMLKMLNLMLVTVSM